MNKKIKKEIETDIFNINITKTDLTIEDYINLQDLFNTNKTIQNDYFDIETSNDINDYQLEIVKIDPEKRKIYLEAKFNDKIKKVSFRIIKDDQNIKIHFNDENKIKYLALGDSISEGFDEQFGFAIPGSYTKDNKVEGIAFGDYLTNFIQELNPKTLEWYKNFSISGSSAKDWMKILDKDFSEIESIKLVENFDKNENYPLKTRNKDMFDHFKSNENLIDAIKDSNLITITLGANDIFHSEFYKNLFQEKYTKEFFMEKIDIVMKKTRIVIIKILDKILEINPNVNIYLVAYPNSEIRLKNILNSYLFAYSDNTVSRNIVEEISHHLNEMLSRVANEKNKLLEKQDLQPKIDFLDIYDAVSWEANAYKNCPSVYGIHPGNYGYRQMAHNILIKMVLPPIGINTKKHLLNDWSNEYIEQQIDNHQIIVLNNANPYDFIKNFEEKFQEKKFLINNKYENVKDTNFGIRVILTELLKGTYKQRVYKIIIKYLLEKYELNNLDSLTKFLNENFNNIFDLIFVKNSSLVIKFFQLFQQHVNDDLINVISIGDVTRILSEIFQNKNFLFDFIKVVIQIPEILTSNSLLITLIHDVINSIKNNEQTKAKIVAFLSEKIQVHHSRIPSVLLNKFLSTYLFNDYNTELYVEFFRNIIFGYKKLQDAQNFDELFMEIFNLNQEVIIKFMVKLYQYGSKLPFFAQYIDNRYFGVFYLNDIKMQMTNDDSELTKQFISKYKTFVFDTIDFSNPIIILFVDFMNNIFDMNLNSVKKIDNHMNFDFLGLVAQNFDTKLLARFINIVFENNSFDSQFYNMILNITPSEYSIKELESLTNTIKILLVKMVKIYSIGGNEEIDVNHFYFKMIYRIILIFEYIQFKLHKNQELNLYNYLKNYNPNLINKIYFGTVDADIDQQSLFVKSFLEINDNEKLKEHIFHICKTCNLF